MLRKKTIKPNLVVADENGNDVEQKVSTGEEAAVGPTKAEKGKHMKSPTAASDDCENGEEKPWENAGPTKRGHRGERSSEHTQHNGYDSRDANHNRGGRHWNRGGSARGKGRPRGNGYNGGRSSRNGGGYGNNGNRERYNSTGNERPVMSNGDVNNRRR